MDARQGGGITASVNMWVLLAEDDSGNNQVEIGVGDMHQAAVEASTVPDGKVQSNSVGDKKRNKKKKTNKQTKAAESDAGANGEEVTASPKVQTSTVGHHKRNDKKETEAAAMAAVANDPTNVRKETKMAPKKPGKQQKQKAALDAESEDGGNNSDQSDEDEDGDEEAAASGSCFRALFLTAVTTALVTFFHVSASAAPGGSRLI